MNTKAYNGLVETLISREDQEKFEWTLGCMLDNGPCQTVVLRGGARTGKTTLMTIVRKVLLSPFTGNYAPRVNFLNEMEMKLLEPGIFAFVEANEDSRLELDALVIKTTGSRIPVNKHFVLMNEIDSELVAIADKCIAVYRELGEDYYSTDRENNR